MTLLAGETSIPITLRRDIQSVRASSNTAGRVKKYATNRSHNVDRPRKKAKPRTEPTVRYHSTAAPISDTMSATTMVCQAPAKPRWALLRIDRPARTSSFNRSKNTTYESTVTPTDTIRPAIPASDSARPCVFERNEMIVQISAPDTSKPMATMIPKQACSRGS